MTKKILRSNNFNANRLHKTVPIRQHHHTRLAFNFSFLTEDRQYNIKSKRLEKTVQLKLLERIAALSERDKASILALPKEQGLEQLSKDELSLRINQEFVNSGRLDECENHYWVFRLSKKGRAIGKICDNIFYILAIDPKFDLYKH